MRLLITGICGFVGSTLARALLENQLPGEGTSICGVDNFSRPGSDSNRLDLKRRGVKIFYGDLRQPSDLEGLPPFDWVIDAAANPSVLAGVDGKTSSRQIQDHNLVSTINLLELCKRHKAGFILLSTSRVYSIPALAGLPMVATNGAFKLDAQAALPAGVSVAGVNENFSTAPPVSLYGASKVASELLALEYAETFGFPVWINRCGVMAGAGQFGRADQGIVSFWINSWLRQRPLKYIGFGGHGYQVRDALHPRDLVPVLQKQFQFTGALSSRIFNFAGGAKNSFSLWQLSQWCENKFGPHSVAADAAPRPFDIPWMVMDSARADKFWGWQGMTGVTDIFEEIAAHAQAHPNWMELSADF